MNAEEMKTRLATELAELTQELKGLGIHNPDVPEDWIATPEDVATPEADPNVAADRNEDWAEKRGTLDALETRFNNIKRALKKIEDDAYGVCEICTAEIEADRLEANPAARTCKAHINDEADLTH